MQTERTFRIGPIRPPSEAGSLLLQITRGCTWNRCRFCDLYRDNTFRTYSLESIKNDIDVMASYADSIGACINEEGRWDREALNHEIEGLSPEARNSFYVVLNWLMHGGENVFLQDGNSLAMKPEKVAEVLLYLRSRFPQIKRITTYARAETLSKIPLEEFRALKKAGLNRIHSGYESGSDKVLELINKGVTSEQEIMAGKNINASGIEFSIYFMPGIGGKALSEENALETARVVREIDPNYVRIRTAVIKRGTGLWEYLRQGTFQLCSDNEKLNEIRLLLENTKNCSGKLASDHIINLLQPLNGDLKADNKKMLGIIKAYFDLPAFEQKMFQLARRKGMVTAIEDMERLPAHKREEMMQICKSITDEGEWDQLMNELVMAYI